VVLACDKDALTELQLADDMSQRFRFQKFYAARSALLCASVRRNFEKTPEQAGTPVQGAFSTALQLRSRPETDATLLESTGDTSPKRDSSCNGCAWPTPDANKTDYREAGQEHAIG
jgi:hypothetical protein